MSGAVTLANCLVEISQDMHQEREELQNLVQQMEKKSGFESKIRRRKWNDQAAIEALLLWQKKRQAQLERRQRILEECFYVLKTAIVMPMDFDVDAADKKRASSPGPCSWSLTPRPLPQRLKSFDDPMPAGFKIRPFADRSPSPSPGRAGRQRGLRHARIKPLQSTGSGRFSSPDVQRILFPDGSSSDTPERGRGPCHIRPLQSVITPTLSAQLLPTPSCQPLRIPSLGPHSLPGHSPSHHSVPGHSPGPNARPGAELQSSSTAFYSVG